MEIRTAARDELRAAHEVRLATWRVAYRGIVPDDFLDAMTITEEKLALFQQRMDEGVVTLVALDGADVIGMATHGPCRDDDRIGEHELFALYVLPSHWGSGVGEQLLTVCGDVTSLWVLEDNHRARAFYAKHGFHPDVTTTIELGVTLVEVRYLFPERRSELPPGKERRSDPCLG